MPELLIILVIVVLLFGAKKIPELAKGLGSGIKNFKNAVKEDDDPTKTSVAPEPATKIEEVKPTSATVQAEASSAPKNA